MLIATFVLLALAVWELYLQIWLDGATCIRTRRSGWIVVEVRRRVIMKRVPDHVSEFPVPREERIMVRRLFGLVLRHSEISVALPDTACGHLDDITPQEFDRQFPNWLRLSGSAG